MAWVKRTVLEEDETKKNVFCFMFPPYSYINIFRRLFTCSGCIESAVIGHIWVV